jgi:hypothetical protein
MKVLSLIGTGVLLLLLGAVTPGYAQEEKQQEAKPQKQEEQAKPEKQQKQQQAKPAKQEKQAQAKPDRREQAKPAKEEKQAKSEKQAHVQQVKAQQDQQRGQQSQQAQGQWAHNGQKDSRGHEYNESRFGRDHHARFEENGGRFYDGRREYSYGGYWFYAGAYPAWFYQQDVYFIMGADGLWHAVAYDNPSLMFQVNIE